MSDKYDKAIEYLVKNPRDVFDAWCTPRSHVAGCLFQFCTPDGMFRHNRNGEACGCLTVVHGGISPAINKALTLRIVLDDRLHSLDTELQAAMDEAKTVAKRRKILAPYAEWQREMDRTIRAKFLAKQAKAEGGAA